MDFFVESIVDSDRIIMLISCPGGGYGTVRDMAARGAWVRARQFTASKFGLEQIRLQELFFFNQKSHIENKTVISFLCETFDKKTLASGKQLTSSKLPRSHPRATGHRITYGTVPTTRARY